MAPSYISSGPYLNLNPVLWALHITVVLTNYGPPLQWRWNPGCPHRACRTSLVPLSVGDAVERSYFSVAFTDPGSVPPSWKPVLDEERGDTDPLTASEFGASPADATNPRVRFCKKCNQLKPPRCHHCSVCGRCVLKMDHHCVWVVNCVGALNYKYFLLFCSIHPLRPLLSRLALLPQFIAFFHLQSRCFECIGISDHAHIIGGLVISLIEAYEKKTTPKWRYDLGRKRNFEQVFGLDKRYWFIPAYSEEDLRRIPALHGLEYPSKPELESQEF
ncbi:hypothetical protein HAX54_050867 [Datura stramonium]|uniref:S-acyltransferase n=1 Tax=Datura stramonium TaxID=4076 RepID=A0ABS8SXG8_DATST|nr:hypothetical protein [Datura stramonium]